MDVRPIFERMPLLMIGGMMALAIGGAAIGAAEHVAQPFTGGQVVSVQDLRFDDRADGAVVVRHGDGTLVEVMQGEQGFLRGVMRGFARERKLDGLGRETPFRLTRWSDGRLTLDDPADGHHVELMAFGPTNAGVFARLLEAAQ